MTSQLRTGTWQSATELVAFHGCRTREELEGLLIEAVRSLLPDDAFALSMVDEQTEQLTVTHTSGARCPLRAGDPVSNATWPGADGERHELRHQQMVLGELLLGRAVPAELGESLRAALAHFTRALVNLVLNTDARQATDEYCANLQALEEGIVLFQESDPESVMARVLSLATQMVEGVAGALFVLDEVGNAKSSLRLQQALGIPDVLLDELVTESGESWSNTLLGQPSQAYARGAQGGLAGLAEHCVPAMLREMIVLALSYHGVQAGVIVIFNPGVDDANASIDRLQRFGQLAAALLHRLSFERIREESVSLGCELEIAETIQKRLVPSESLPCEDYDFAWHTLAAKSIGGDYIDFVQSDLGDIYAIVADASGHGVNSALLMTSFRANYRGSAFWQEMPELAAGLNSQVVHEVGPTGMFITAVLVRIEDDSRRLTVASAGHNPTMLYRAATGKVEQIESHGPPMGFMAGIDYEGYDGELAAGDVLLMYTDGITEATNGELEMFGEERLERLLIDNASRGSQQILDACLQDLASYTSAEQHEDDVSLMVITAR